MIGRGGYRFLPDGREARGVLPWVIAIMTFLAALAVAGGLMLYDATSQWRTTLSRSWTVQVVEADPALREAQARAAVKLLAEIDGVTSVRALGDAEARALLEPWLGAGSQSADLPVPALIDVAVAPSASLSPANVRHRLQAVAPSARLDDHDRWLRQLGAFAGALQLTAFAIVVVSLLATMGVVGFSTRAGLMGHRATIEILHLMGAEDSAIGREFQRQYLFHGFKGGLAGVAAAVATIAGLGWMAQRLSSGLLGGFTPGPLVWLSLAVLPLAVAVLTMATARLTVHRALADYV